MWISAGKFFSTEVVYSFYYYYFSLYPWVNKYCEYPIGHPEIITENFLTITMETPEKERYFGLLKGKFLPPRKLLHPVLPWKSPSGKLCFVLCRTCCEKSQNSRCYHNENERALTGTYASPEVYEALKMGYKIIKLHEVWHYRKKSTKLFTS